MRASSVIACLHQAEHQRVLHHRSHHHPQTPTAPPVSVLEENEDPPPSYQEACAQENLDNRSECFSVTHNTRSNEFGQTDKCPTDFGRDVFGNLRPRLDEIDYGHHDNSSRTPLHPKIQFQNSKNSSKVRHQTSNPSPHLSSFEAGMIPQIKIGEVYAALDRFQEKRNNYKLFKSSKTNQYLVTNVETYCIWGYQLRTNYEFRQLVRIHRPYTGSRIVNERVNRHISEWDVDVPEQHGSGTKQFRVPRTTTVTSCESCNGEGYNPCSRCRGDGEISCECCGGSGHQYVTEAHRKRDTCHQQRVETCSECHGATITRCHMCHGSSKTTCRDCSGAGKIEIYLQLLLRWETKQNTHFVDQSEVPFTFLKRSKAVQVYENFSKTGPISPLTTHDCNHKKVIVVSKNLIKSHKLSSMDYAIRKQAHSISLVPIYKISCQKSSKKKTFWIAGTNHNIYKEPSSLGLVSFL